VGLARRCFGSVVITGASRQNPGTTPESGITILIVSSASSRRSALVASRPTVRTVILPEVEIIWSTA